MRNGRRIRQTIGVCPRWPTRSDGPIARTGSPSPELRAEFKAKYNRELEPPKTWDELIEVAKFFTGKEIDGKKVYGSYVFSERGSEGITMGATNAMYNYGFDYMDPKKPYQMAGIVNSEGAAKGLDVYKSCLPAASRQV